MTEPRTPEPSPSAQPLGASPPSATSGVPGVDPTAAPPSPAPTMQSSSGPAPGAAPPVLVAPGSVPVGSVPAGPDAAEVARETLENLTATTRHWLAGLDPTGWRPTLIVAGIIAALVLGTQLINAAIPTPGARPVPGVPSVPGPTGPGATVAIGDNARFTLVSGWQITDRYTDQFPGVAIQKGDVFMEVRATATRTNAAASDLLAQFRGIIAAQLAGFQSTTPSPVSTSSLNGLRTNYQGTNKNGNVQEGVMFVFVSPSGTGILAHAGGQRGSIEPLLNEIQAMVDSLEVR